MLYRNTDTKLPFTTEPYSPSSGTCNTLNPMPVLANSAPRWIVRRSPGLETQHVELKKTSCWTLDHAKLRYAIAFVTPKPQNPTNSSK